jgi:hypothetical protein
MKKIFYLFIASLALTSVSCDKDFEEINTSPNSSQVTDPNLLLSSTITATQNVLYNAQIGGDMGLCWAQHWSKVQYNDEEKYIPRRGNMNLVWTAMYTSVITEANAAYELAGVDGNTNLQGAALVMKANAYQILTDVFGPVPYTQATTPGIVKPAFDTEEVVYDGILAMLDQAEVLFASGTGSITASADLVYGGDMTKWRKLAASLKLKALMRISSKRSVGTDIQALIDSGLLFSSNADSAQLAYTSAQPDANPIYETIVFANRAEYKVSSVLVSQLNGLSDPRLSVFAQLNNSSAYVGNVPGTENPGNYAGFSSPGTFYLNPTLPGVLLSYSQVELYLAEAINEAIISGTLADARMHYVNGINANFSFNGLAPNPGYTGSGVVNFTTQADARTKIGTQMWLTLYGQGIEAWTEWRRTGLPSLSIVVDAAITSIPKRFYYSTDSQSYNQANYASASASLDNGDTMLSKVWWMN